MQLTQHATITTEEAGNIAITAAEGGIGYWAQIDEYVWTRWQNEETGDPKPIGPYFTFYHIAEEDPPDSGKYNWTNEYAITVQLIERGVNLFLNGVEGNFEGRQFADMDDISAMDANEADCVIQLGVFGRLVYG